MLRIHVVAFSMQAKLASVWRIKRKRLMRTAFDKSVALVWWRVEGVSVVDVQR
jgi:hypothetical protein